MNILVNCSNLKKGGGLQVASSICSNLNHYSSHTFYVVLSSALNDLIKVLTSFPNVKVVTYDSHNSFRVLVTGRDELLDTIVKRKNIQVVFSIFGPIAWKPRCPHLCGFARAHLVLSSSPYFQRMTRTEKIRNKINQVVLKFFFKRGVTAFFTENSYISNKWKTLVGNREVYTVTNYYNQIFDDNDLWKEYPLPAFDGKTFLCISANYPHKNLEIAISVARELIKIDSDFKFRFVFSITPQQFPKIPNDLKECFLLIGKVQVCECPSLYCQSDVMFQPTLLECFTATYPEAMRMHVPIVTTDIDFARGLCSDAALYYSPLDSSDAAKQLYKVCKNEDISKQLVNNGIKQLLTFDNYLQRTDKLISIIESLRK